MADATIIVDDCCCDSIPPLVFCCAQFGSLAAAPEIDNVCLAVQNTTSGLEGYLVASALYQGGGIGVQNQISGMFGFANQITIGGKVHCIFQQFNFWIQCSDHFTGTVGNLDIVIGAPQSIMVFSGEECVVVMAGVPASAPSSGAFVSTALDPYAEAGLSYCQTSPDTPSGVSDCFFQPSDSFFTLTSVSIPCAEGIDDAPGQVLDTIDVNFTLPFLDPVTDEFVTIPQTFTIVPSIMSVSGQSPPDSSNCAALSTLPADPPIGFGGNLDNMLPLVSGCDCGDGPFDDYWDNGRPPYMPPNLGPSPCCPSGQQTAHIPVVFQGGGASCGCATGVVAEMIFNAHYADPNAGWFNVHSWHVSTILCGAFFSLTIICNPDTGTVELVEWHWGGASVAASVSFPCTGQEGGGTVFSVTGLTTGAGFPCNGGLTIEIIV